MSPLVFLGAALAVFVVVSAVSWLVHRERRSSFESSIEQFQHEMNVLSPGEQRARRKNRR